MGLPRWLAGFCTTHVVKSQVVQKPKSTGASPVGFACLRISETGGNRLRAPLQSHRDLQSRVGQAQLERWPTLSKRLEFGVGWHGETPLVRPLDILPNIKLALALISVAVERATEFNLSLHNFCGSVLRSASQSVLDLP